MGNAVPRPRAAFEEVAGGCGGHRRPDAADDEDLHHLVDRLTPQQVRRLRLFVHQDAELSTAAADADDGSRLAGLIGSIDGPPDLADRHDGYVRERFSGSA